MRVIQYPAAVVMNLDSSGILGRPVQPGDDSGVCRPFYCFAIMVENSPLRMRTGRPSTNFATASSP
jgi:hypothetical protein